MPVFYLDTSAILKRYRLEQGTEVVDALFRQAPPSDRFFSSFLSFLEITSAIHRVVASRQMDAALGSAILVSFRHDQADLLFRLWSLTDDIVLAAVSVAEQHKLRSGDAIHLATALAIASVAPRAAIVMVSSDRELLLSSARAGLAVLNPVESDAVGQLHRLRHPLA